jgi:hypothetical protein
MAQSPYIPSTRETSVQKIVRKRTKTYSFVALVDIAILEHHLEEEKKKKKKRKKRK